MAHKRAIIGRKVYTVALRTLVQSSQSELCKNLIIKKKWMGVFNLLFPIACVELAKTVPTSFHKMLMSASAQLISVDVALVMSRTIYTGRRTQLNLYRSYVLPVLMFL